MRKLFTLVFAISLFSYAPVLAQNGGMHIKGPATPTLKTGTYLIITGDLKVSVTDGLIIKPSTYVTVEGNMTLNARKGITVQTSTTTGSPRGSLIFNGDSVYRSNRGSIEVQSYITGGGAGYNNDYYMHFVGAPVEDTTPGWVKKVRLQQFDMTYLDTYAFEWDATVDTTAGQPWVNVYPYWYPVPEADGLTLSNYSTGNNDTIIMEGFPIHGNVTYSIRHYTNNHLELICNPFPSAIDFDQFASDNGLVIEDKYFIYDASTGNYIQRSNGSGGSQYIQYGQGFFVKTRRSADITFTEDHKVHNNAAFRDQNPNELSIHVSGGTHNYEDNLYIRFMDDATVNFDDFDAKKWNSINTGPTMIRSKSNDGVELAINMLPTDMLNFGETTVPVYFECGENAQYTFSFKGVSSFEGDAEIWLEDLQTGDEWVSVTEDDFTYTFSASPGDEKYRFNIHFFGPTSVEEPGIGHEGRILIYSSGNDAYVVNKSEETIQKVTIFDIMGQEVLTKEISNKQITRKFHIPGQTGYYVVRVLTDKQVHTGKILILK